LTKLLKVLLFKPVPLTIGTAFGAAGEELLVGTTAYEEMSYRA